MKLLQHKILFGYLICVVVIGSMVAILLHERSRVLQIETEMKRLHHVQQNVNTAHRYITLLAMRGETVLAWEEEDYTILFTPFPLGFYTAIYVQGERGICQQRANRLS